MIVSTQTNLYFTDGIHVQHHCFYYENNNALSPDILPFCIGESVLKWHIEKTEANVNAVFTFTQLSEKNITSEQLYHWSAPIDIIERYQIYLNHLMMKNRSLEMDTELFYNCTSPAFGRQCQYKLDIPHETLSMQSNIVLYYRSQLSDFDTMPLTCYVHLKCDRGIQTICLDWTEICDGKVDCSNGIDENNCRSLATNVCEDDEYQYNNGQCLFSTLEVLPPTYFDKPSYAGKPANSYTIPSFENEDIVCSWRQSSTISPFTSSCKHNRHKAIEQAIFSTVSTTNISKNCLLALQCYTKISPTNSSPLCFDFCQNDNCLELIESACQNDIFFYPTVPIAFHHVYFAYTKQYIVKSATMNYILPEYICYNEQLCSEFRVNATLLRFQGRICRHREDISLALKNSTTFTYNDFLRLIFSQISHCNRIINNNLTVCNSSMMYQCQNSSRCIPISYIGDSIRDCDYEDDEKQSIIDKICSTNPAGLFYKCANENKCIHRQRLHDKTCDCQQSQTGYCDDEKNFFRGRGTDIEYLRMCDGSVYNEPILIEGQIHTDETDCEQWPCINRRTRCNYAWDCSDGADEIGCYTSPVMLCSLNHHICVSPHTNHFFCLPIQKVHDNIIDCLGAIDEPAICPKNNFTSSDLFIYCKQNNSIECWPMTILCLSKPHCDNGNTTKYCELSIGVDNPFSLMKRISSTNLDNSFELKFNANIKSHSSTMDSSEKYYCHHGLPVQVLLNSETHLTAKTCLCPPSYYGHRCQYQNQRVSLIIQMNTPASSVQTPFVFIVSLIDNSIQRIIHSYWQLAFVRASGHQSVFNVQLTYSHRPKDLSKQYFIHIDIYERISLRYRGSMFIALKYPFLPVERAFIQINLPKVNDITQSCVNRQCNHGQCVYYLNHPHSNFCRCQPGWTGKYCDIPHKCMCSSDSLCIGATADNRSICLCSMDKFGSKCFLSKNTCQQNSCLNGGFCVPASYHMRSHAMYVCICPKEFRGERCEEASQKYFISVHNTIELSLPSQIFLYFTQSHSQELYIKGGSSTIICGGESSINDYFPYRFGTMIIQLSRSRFYLFESYKINYASSTGNLTIHPSYRCLTIHEVFNESMANMHLIRRIKYYHVPCQNRLSNLRCFHDEIYLCLCQDLYNQRIADCIKFENILQFSPPTFSYDEMEHFCNAKKHINFSTYATSSTTSLASVTSNTSNITKSLIDITTSSNSAYIFSFNIFILLVCSCIH